MKILPTVLPKMSNLTVSANGTILLFSLRFSWLTPKAATVAARKHFPLLANVCKVIQSLMQLP